MPIIICASSPAAAGRLPDRAERRGDTCVPGLVFVLLVVAVLAVIIARGEVMAMWPAAARLYALAGLPAMPSGPGLELGEVIPARTAGGLIIEGNITNA